MNNFGKSFQFYVKDYHQVIYTCNAGDKDSNCKIVWAGHGTGRVYNVEEVKKHITSGWWIVIPTPTESTEEILTCEKGPWELIQEALTDSNGRISVEVFKGSYTISHESLTECFDNVEEEDLGRLLDALVVLDGFC